MHALNFLIFFFRLTIKREKEGLFIVYCLPLRSCFDHFRVVKSILYITIYFSIFNEDLRVEKLKIEFSHKTTW